MIMSLHRVFSCQNEPDSRCLTSCLFDLLCAIWHSIHQKQTRGGEPLLGWAEALLVESKALSRMAAISSGWRGCHARLSTFCPLEGGTLEGTDSHFVFWRGIQEVLLQFLGSSTAWGYPQGHSLKRRDAELPYLTSLGVRIGWISIIFLCKSM